MKTKEDNEEEHADSQNIHRPAHLRSRQVDGARGSADRPEQGRYHSRLPGGRRRRGGGDQESRQRREAAVRARRHLGARELHQPREGAGRRRQADHHGRAHALGRGEGQGRPPRRRHAHDGRRRARRREGLRVRLLPVPRKGAAGGLVQAPAPGRRTGRFGWRSEGPGGFEGGEGECGEVCVSDCGYGGCWGVEYKGLMIK